MTLSPGSTPYPSRQTRRTRLPVFQADLRLLGARPWLPPRWRLMQELETNLGGTGGQTGPVPAGFAAGCTCDRDGGSGFRRRAQAGGWRKRATRHPARDIEETVPSTAHEEASALGPDHPPKQLLELRDADGAPRKVLAVSVQASTLRNPRCPLGVCRS
jgi:hypothetical protein